MKPITATTLRPSDSTTRMPALTKGAQPKSPRNWAETARRLLDALKRSLACPHI